MLTFKGTEILTKATASGSCTILIVFFKKNINEDTEIFKRMFKHVLKCFCTLHARRSGADYDQVLLFVSLA